MTNAIPLIKNFSTTRFLIKEKNQKEFERVSGFNHDRYREKLLEVFND